jgi:hypothetical protein
MRRREGTTNIIQRYLLFKRLTSQSIEQFRDISINDFDLNITEHIEELEEIDSSVTPLIYASYYGMVALS